MVGNDWVVCFSGGLGFGGAGVGSIAQAGKQQVISESLVFLPRDWFVDLIPGFGLANFGISSLFPSVIRWVKRRLASIARWPGELSLWARRNFIAALSGRCGSFLNV